MRVRPALVSRAVASTVACTVGLIALAGCGGSDTPTPSPSAKSSTLLPTDAPSTPTASPATGPEVSGTGYTFNLPDGWVNITGAAKESEPRIDAAGRAGTATKPYTANLNVLTTDSTVDGEPTKQQLEQLARQTRQEILSVVPKVETVGLTDLGGSQAVHQEGDAQYGTQPFYLVQYATVHDGSNYILTFSFPTGVDQDARSAVIDPVLASFAFEGAEQ